MNRLEENLNAHLHIQMFDIQKIKRDIRQEIRGVEVKVEAIKNSRIQILCYHCGKKGHIKRFCKQMKQDLKEGKKEENTEK